MQDLKVGDKVAVYEIGERLRCEVEGIEGKQVTVRAIGGIFPASFVLHRKYCYKLTPKAKRIEVELLRKVTINCLNCGSDIDVRLSEIFQATTKFYSMHTRGSKMIACGGCRCVHEIVDVLDVRKYS